MKGFFTKDIILGEKGFCVIKNFIHDFYLKIPNSTGETFQIKT